MNTNNKRGNREDALLVLPVAFDNQGGLASTEQRGGAAALRCRLCTGAAAVGLCGVSVLKARSQVGG